MFPTNGRAGDAGCMARGLEWQLFADNTLSQGPGHDNSVNEERGVEVCQAAHQGLGFVVRWSCTVGMSGRDAPHEGAHPLHSDPWALAVTTPLALRSH